MHSYFEARQHYLADCQNRRLQRGRWECESYIALRRGKARLVAAYALGAECFARAWTEMSFAERRRYLANPQNKAARETLEDAQFRSIVRNLCLTRQVPALRMQSRGTVYL